MILLLLFFVLLILLYFRYLISFKTNFYREKLTPFECGFDPLITGQVSLYIRYYIFSLIFLVFDVEVVLLLPIVTVIKRLCLVYFSYIVFFFFLLLLLWGLMIEFLDCSFEWRL